MPFAVMVVICLGVWGLWFSKCCMRGDLRVAGVREGSRFCFGSAAVVRLLFVVVFLCGLAI